MDGAFDMIHYGHMNTFQLARSLGTYLIVGMNSDESIIQSKGLLLMDDQERLTMVQGCKFVDEIVPGCPYIIIRSIWIILFRNVFPFFYQFGYFMLIIF